MSVILQIRNTPTFLPEYTLLTVKLWQNNRSVETKKATGRLLFLVGAANETRARFAGGTRPCFSSPQRTLVPRVRVEMCIKTKKSNRKAAFFCWSGKRDSNSRPRPWQGRALPTELLPHLSFMASAWRQLPQMVKRMRLELTRQYCHYPLKVARLPIPPSLHCLRLSVSQSAQNRTRTCTSLNTRT